MTHYRLAQAQLNATEIHGGAVLAEALALRVGESWRGGLPLWPGDQASGLWWRIISSMLILCP